MLFAWWTVYRGCTITSNIADVAAVRIKRYELIFYRKTSKSPRVRYSSCAKLLKRFLKLSQTIYKIKNEIYKH